jgi:LacI family transcriptional regulator
VFAASDELAVGFVQGARDQGLMAGRDYQIIGFDRQQLGMDLPEGPLTTIEVPRVAMGVRGAELLTARLLDPDQPVHRTYLGCSLFEGKTTRSSQRRNE